MISAVFEPKRRFRFIRRFRFKRTQPVKLVGLVLVILFPIALAAQERDPSPMKNQSATSAAAQANVSTAGDEADSAPTDWSADLASDTDTNAPQQANAKPSQTTPPPGQTRPKIPGSMVGYIDNAIVASQIRIRFEAAFHNNSPDRAEFFYPQYAGLNGPGPNSVVADLNFQQLYLYGEYAPIKRFSFFTQVPVRWIQPQLTVANVNPGLFPPFPNVNEAGLSDVAAGFKLAAVASSNQYLTFQFQAYFPSGSASVGLGTRHYSVEPALLYYRRLSDRMVLEAQVGDSHPIGGSTCLLPCNTITSSKTLGDGFAGDVFFYGVGPSYVLYRGENVWIAPVIELVGWRVLGGLETNCISGVLNGMPNSCANQVGVPASGTNIVNAKLGARTAVGAHSSF